MESKSKLKAKGLNTDEHDEVRLKRMTGEGSPRVKGSSEVTVSGTNVKKKLQFIHKSTDSDI